MIRLFTLLLCVAGAWNFKLITGPTCGREASSNLIHQNPWVVYLEYWRGNHRTDIRCVATLVGSRHLITAAHCIRTPKFTRLVARLGEYDLARQVDCVSGICADPIVRLEVAEAIVHPDYHGNGHDIAVLRLAEAAPYTEFIRPICLPSGQLPHAVTFVSTGWGEIPTKRYYSAIKKIIPLPLWERAACEAAYEHQEISDDFICAGGEEGIDTCRGDSGGPLVWIKDRAELWGVTSAGNTKCGTKNFPGIYTGVVDNLEWVQNVISGSYQNIGYI